MSESDVSWAKNGFGAALLSLDDENTPVPEDEEETHEGGEQNGDEEVTKQQVGTGEKRIKRKKLNVD